MTVDVSDIRLFRTWCTCWMRLMNFSRWSEVWDNSLHPRYSETSHVKRSWRRVICTLLVPLELSAHLSVLLPSHNYVTYFPSFSQNVYLLCWVPHNDHSSCKRRRRSVFSTQSVHCIVLPVSMSASWAGYSLINTNLVNSLSEADCWRTSFALLASFMTHLTLHEGSLSLSCLKTG